MGRIPAEKSVVKQVWFIPESAAGSGGTMQAQENFAIFDDDDDDDDGDDAQNLSSDFVEWSCAVVITTTPQHS